MSESKYSSMSTDALRCIYVKEFKKAMRVVSMSNVSAVPYNGFYGCYGYAPAVARSLRDVTTSLHLIKEELRHRETTISDGPPRRETTNTADGTRRRSNYRDSVTVYGDGACRAIAIPSTRAVIPLIAEVEMVTMATATALPTSRS
jgi:hypothetical protein